MEAKLIKVDNGWVLMVDNIMYATDENAPYARLSVKNCQTIERDYDLDELAKEKYPYEKTEMFSCFELDCKQEGFIEGAKTILEILGDKKFSEGGVLKVVTHILNELVFVDGFDKQYLFPETVYQETTAKCNSLQQTEWDVSFNPEEKDSEGCLILKRL